MERLRDLPAPAKFGIVGVAMLTLAAIAGFVLTLAILAVANGILGVDLDAVPLSWTTVPIVLLVLLGWRRSLRALESNR